MVSNQQRGPLAALSRRGRESTGRPRLFALSPSIDILLATFNGQPYLAEQLASLDRQTSRSFRILARDDGSDDQTVATLEQFARASDRAVILVPTNGKRRGPSGNFDELLSRATAPYVMFCDQDDRWDADKVETFEAAMRKLEAAHGSRTPILVHSNLRVVDASLRSLGDSFWRYQLIDPHGGSSLARLLGQNVVTGSASMMNRALIELARPVPPEAIMHDWWIALVAVAFGVIGTIDRATGDYRQHGGNDTGAKRWDRSYIIAKLREVGDRSALAAILARTTRQATAFAGRFEHRLSARQLAVVRDYAALSERSFLHRRWTIVRRGFWKHGRLRNLGLLARV